MIRLFSISALLILTGLCGFKNPVNTPVTPAYHAVVLTRITNSKSTAGNERDITRIVYISNKAADSVNVYTVNEGAVLTAVGYSVIKVKEGVNLIGKPLFSEQEKTDTIKFVFNDKNQSVIVNRADVYQLYPAYYAELKQQGQVKHSVTALLSLLNDNIGEYPIADALQLQMFQAGKQLGKQIKQAKIVTRRSQSDEVTDTWNCSYRYNSSGKLASVKAASGADVRFTKQVAYAGSNVSSIKCYKNIEDRQVTNRTIRYQSNNNQKLQWTDKVTETGKNVETTLVSTLTRRDINSVKKINASQSEILNFVK